MKRETMYHIVSFKVSREMQKDIEAYCLKHRIECKSEFIRFAVAQVLRPEIEDSDLVFSSLQQLHNKLHGVERQQDVLFSYLNYLAQHFLVYHPEIPGEYKQAAATSAIERYSKMFRAFENQLKETPSMFKSLLADFVGD